MIKTFVNYGKNLENMKINNGKCIKFFYINQAQEHYEVHSKVFVVIYYLVPLIYLSKHDECCHKSQRHRASENEQIQSK